MATLDQRTIHELSKLTFEEIDNCSCEAYRHEILWYGIDAVVHIYLMQMAKAVPQGKLTKEEFIQEYKLGPSKFPRCFGVLLEDIESKGIFVPPQVYCNHLNWKGERYDRDVALFSKDYRNVLINHGKFCPVNHEACATGKYVYAEELTERVWQSSDFENTELLQQGVRFGIDLWLESIGTFERMKLGKKMTVDGLEKYVRPPQPPRITALGEKLMVYYATLISEWTTLPIHSFLTEHLSQQIKSK